MWLSIEICVCNCKSRENFNLYVSEIRFPTTGIPNTKAFYEITSIQDALMLHEELKRKEKGEWKENDEEYEGTFLTMRKLSFSSTPNLEGVIY